MKTSDSGIFIEIYTSVAKKMQYIQYIYISLNFVMSDCQLATAPTCNVSMVASSIVTKP